MIAEAVTAGDREAAAEGAQRARRVAARAVAGGMTWAGVRASLAVYRVDVVDALARHKPAFDPRSGEFVDEVRPKRARATPGLTLDDRLAIVIERSGAAGVTVSRIRRTMSDIGAGALGEALPRLGEGGRIQHRVRQAGGRGSRVTDWYYAASIEAPRPALPEGRRAGDWYPEDEASPDPVVLGQG